MYMQIWLQRKKVNNVLNTFGVHVFLLTEKTSVTEVQNYHFSCSSTDVFNELCQETDLEEPINL